MKSLMIKFDPRIIYILLTLAALAAAAGAGTGIDGYGGWSIP